MRGGRERLGLMKKGARKIGSMSKGVADHWPVIYKIITSTHMNNNMKTINT